MFIAHKIELIPNNKQKTFFKKGCGTSRTAYNWALENWNKKYKNGEKVNERILRKELNAIKRDDFPWMLEVSKSTPQQAIKDLGTAFKRFFVPDKNGKKSGYPKFKKKGYNDSFRIDNGPLVKGANAIQVLGNKIKIPKLGWVKMTESLRFEGQIKQATISRQADRWFVSLMVDTNVHPNEFRKNQVGVVGVDLGVKSLAVLSTGETIVGPKALQRAQRKLRRANRVLHRREPKGKNRAKARMKVAKIHRKVANIRKDSLHKLTTHLCLNHETVVIEDLNVKGMLKNHKLARRIADAGFGEFRRQLTYKSEIYGCELVLADRFYPSSKTCSSCGNVKKDLKLSERVYECDVCGFELDRDLNAAINLMHLAVSSTERINACGGLSSGMGSISCETGTGEAGNKLQVDLDRSEHL